MAKGKIVKETIALTEGAKGKGKKREPASTTTEEDPEGLPVSRTIKKMPKMKGMKSYEEKLELLKKEAGARGKGTTGKIVEEEIKIGGKTVSKKKAQGGLG